MKRKYNIDNLDNLNNLFESLTIKPNEITNISNENIKKQSKYNNHYITRYKMFIINKMNDIYPNNNIKININDNDLVFNNLIKDWNKTNKYQFNLIKYR
jgi:hypothetical protein